MRKMVPGLLCCVVCTAVVPVARAERLAFTDEAAYVAALASRGYTVVQESFENDATWGSVRSTIPDGPHSAPTITSQDIAWAANNANSGITTSNGAARSGQWGVYSLPHGDFANGINDGFVVSSANTLTAVGGWIRTSTPYASIVFIVDGDTAAPVDFEGATLGTESRFFGVIDTAGIQSLEVLETEGTIDDQKLIFADDFTFAVLSPPLVNPAALEFAGTLVGSITAGDLASLLQSDDDRLEIAAAALPGVLHHSLTLVVARSATLVPSRLDLVVESSNDALVQLASVAAYNFDTSTWDALGLLPGAGPTDLRKGFLQVPDPQAYVRGTDGVVLVAIYSLGIGPASPWGYALGVDQISIDATP